MITLMTQKVFSNKKESFKKMWVFYLLMYYYYFKYHYILHISVKLKNINFIQAKGNLEF